MPIIRIANCHTTGGRAYEDLARLAELLAETCVEARIHGIESTDVISVVDGGRRLRRGDDVIIIQVEGLFDTPERTFADRQRLAKLLARCAHRFYLGHHAIEVFVNRFDPERDPFVKLDKVEKLEKKST